MDRRIHHDGPGRSTEGHAQVGPRLLPEMPRGGTRALRAGRITGVKVKR